MRISKKTLKKNSENLPSIFSLSPKTDLNNDSMPGYDVYRKYLTKAFNKTCIHNIVVTGDFGIGKSSVIRSFDKDYCKRRDSGFLYVSIADFRVNETDATKERKNSRRKYSSKNLLINSNKQNVLERRLLLQIYASFHRKDLPSTSFKMVQEHNFFSRFIIPIFGAFALLTALLLFFFEPISVLLKEILTQIYTIQFKNSNLEVKEQARLLQDVVSSIESNEQKIHLSLYLVMIIISVMATYFVIQYIILKWHAKSLTIKADTFEATCEKEACESYLDQHKTEIVYCLEKIAHRINYTLVLEDLDRLSKTECLEIFSRLHEINNLVNLRLSKKRGQKRIRFVYVVNDSIINHLNHSKFADYTLAIFPRVNEKTVERVLLDNLSNINDELNEELNIHLAPNKQNISSNSVVAIVATYLSDYRLQFAILNEYSMLFRLYFNSNSKTTKEPVTKTAESILAFVIYKNLFPNDYSKILIGKSDVFPIYNPSKFKNNKKKELLDKLICTDSPFLTPNCLYYAGYSRDNIINLYVEKLNNNLEETLNHTKKESHKELQEALVFYCNNNLFEKIFACSTKEDKDIIESLYKKVQIVIRYMIEHKINNYNWLLNNNIPAIFVLEILSFTDFDDDMLKEFFGQAGLDIESNVSLFDKCKGQTVNNNVISGTNSICNARDLNEREYMILRLGIGEKYTSANSVRVNGTYKPLNRNL